MFFNLSVAPHFFELIKLPGFRLHHMHNDIHIINQYPMHTTVAFMAVRNFIKGFFDMGFNEVGNSANLDGTGCLADNEKICYSLWNFSQIKRYYVFSFFLLNCIDDCFTD